MILNRNIKHIRRQGPVLLSKLGFNYVRVASYKLGLNGGTVCFLIREKQNPTILYCAHITSWFKELQVEQIFPVNVVVDSKVSID